MIASHRPRFFALVVLGLLALTGCGSPRPTLDLETPDTLADGRKVMRAGEHRLVWLGELVDGAFPTSARCDAVALVSTDPSVLRVVSHQESSGSDTFELEAVRQGNAKVLGLCGGVALEASVLVTCDPA